jgi:MHS family shikimate/dehydroshikimate transporter-like MFS transporter
MAGSTVLRDVPSREASSMRHIVLASVLGTVVEWYDFLVYGTAAALVFGKLFFPSSDPAVGTIASLGAYALGFVARPLGGAIFGHFGDRLGRRTMLMLTLLIMGAGTFLIGCLPTYATIGIWAPILLIALRLLQGLGIGGEWGGAVLMVVENAPRHRRGLLGSLVQLGYPLGLVAATGMFALMQLLPDADFLAWGWRVPFLISAVLIGVAVFVRLRLLETAAFQAMTATSKPARIPLAEVLTRHRRAFFVAIGLKVSEIAWVSILTVFCIAYVQNTLKLPGRVIVNGILLAGGVELVTMPLAGWLSDRIGRKPIYIFGTIFSILAAFPLFYLLDTRDPLTIALAVTVALSLGQGIMFCLHASFMPELFATRVRYSGMSMGFQIGAALSGGFTPLIAAGLLVWAGSTWPVSVYLIALALISLAAVLVSRETASDDLTVELIE